MRNVLKTRLLSLMIAAVALTALMPEPAWASLPPPSVPGPAAAGALAGAAIIGAIVIAKLWRRR